MAAERSRRGLDWLNFFVADVQTGFGPFVAVYLTTQAWTEVQIGFALSLGTMTAMISRCRPAPWSTPCTTSGAPPSWRCWPSPRRRSCWRPAFHPAGAAL
ncbi:hypothetical protein [Teichococcus aestuarii]|uniref:hypothetical protein n=1 Tax=Teichococcus aestuarii TaxID=568898 RepID=UPI003608556D